jgi:hypothetical protein
VSPARAIFVQGGRRVLLSPAWQVSICSKVSRRDQIREATGLGRVCQLVEEYECDIRRLTPTGYAATAAAVTRGISCQPSIFRIMLRGSTRPVSVCRRALGTSTRVGPTLVVSVQSVASTTTTWWCSP